LFFVEYEPGPQNTGDPVDDFLVNRANKGKTVRSSLFDYLMRTNTEDTPLKVLYFDGKEESDISSSVSKESLRSASAKTGVSKWDGPTGPFSTLYLYGPVLWEFHGHNYPDRKLLENSMPAWAMPVEEQEKRAHIPKTVRQAVYERDGGRCRYCGSTKDLHYDHILAHSKGGSDTVENLQLLCEKCNLSKGSGF
jgi:hypothetical protein